MGLFFKKFVLWGILLVIFGSLQPIALWVQPAEASKTTIHKLEQKKRSNQQQLNRIKQLKKQIILKEQYVTSHIIQNQRRLESSRYSLEFQEANLDKTKAQLKTLENSLDIALAEQQQLAAQVGKRLRSIYMGEHLSFLQMFLDAGNIATLLDRMYYKERILAQDKKLYASYLAKTKALEEKKNALAEQKNQLAITIQRIQAYQGQLQEAMVLDRLLVQKLKTSRDAYEAAENQLQQESFNIERQILNLTKAGGYVLGSTGRFIAPVLAAITSGFGNRFHPIFRTQRFHSGIDFGGGHGTPIRAADGGVVIQAGWQGGYGKVVIINHGSKAGKNLTTLYGHMSRTAVRAGQQIAKGQTIGYVGSTGFSTGPHLHFEVRENGRPVNPMSFLK